MKKKKKNDTPEIQDVEESETPENVAPAQSAGERRAQRRLAREAERTPEQSRVALRKKVRLLYDLQRLRIQSGGRGMPKADGAEIQLHELDIALLDQRSNDLLRAEKAALADIGDHLKTIPFYRDVLSDKVRFRGLGPTMAAVILSEYDIARLDTPSKMWAFAGLAPVPAQRCGRCHVPLKQGEDGELVHAWIARGPKKKPGADDGKAEKEEKPKCKEVRDPYDSGRAMRPERGIKLPYNAFLKTKLIGVLGPCLLKANSPWRGRYDDYKHRKASSGWGTSDAHRHNAANRYMVKILLLEIWREWRAHEGLPIRESYQEQYLHHRHGQMGAARAATR